MSEFDLVPSVPIAVSLRTHQELSEAFNVRKQNAATKVIRYVSFTNVRLYLLEWTIALKHEFLSFGGRRSFIDRSTTEYLNYRYTNHSVTRYSVNRIEFVLLRCDRSHYDHVVIIIPSFFIQKRIVGLSGY